MLYSLLINKNSKSSLAGTVANQGLKVKAEGLEFAIAMNQVLGLKYFDLN